MKAQLTILSALLALALPAAAEDQTGAPLPPSPGVPLVPVAPGTPNLPATAPQSAPAAAGTQPRVVDLNEAQTARAALDELIRAYEVGNLSLLQARLDPAMIGYQRFLDGAREDANRLKQIRIHLFDTQTTIGPDIAVVQTNWEKRFISVTSFQPGLFSGSSKFMLQKKPTGWTVIAFAGDNLFSSASGVLGQIRVNGGVAMVTLPPAATIQGGLSVPLSIEVVDPDQAGMHSVIVDATTSSGDRESLTLAETTPGRFTSVVSLLHAPAVVGDGRIQAAPGSLTLRYLDRNPGNDRPPATVSLTIQLR
jgi:hypothetical protein